MRLLLIPVILLSSSLFMGAAVELTSPDGQLLLEIEPSAAEFSFSVTYKERIVVENAVIGLEIAGYGIAGDDPELVGETRESVSGWVEPVVQQKRASIREAYNAVSLEFAAPEKGDSPFVVEFRAYDDGFAYRFVTSIANGIEVRQERMRLEFPAGSTTHFPEEEKRISHNERLYPEIGLDELDASRFASMPAMVTVPGAGRILLAESDHNDYPVMWLRGAEGNALTADFAKFVLEAAPDPRRPDRNLKIVEEADFLARTVGKRSFPWRAFMVSDRDGTFVESDLVYLLARPAQIAETDWIRTGRVAWDWYNALNIYGVDFESGINNATYKYYIDFAAEFGLEYIILDEGWSASTTDILHPNPDIDVPALVAYGAERGVGIILWTLWGPVNRDMEAIFDRYAEWGVKGVKIDFMQRSDQAMVAFYERAAAAAAKRRLLLDFHGCFSPSGFTRAWPNVLTFEGVKGNENNKWSQDITAEHNVTIPFIRMAAGPMDYTPGAMANSQPVSHRIRYLRPMSIGTRCHEIAKYVVFESPLQMLCDTPSRYLRERESTTFIAQIPSVWDDTRVLEAALGDFIVIARRSGDKWFLAAMTDGDPRSLSIDLGFLTGASYTAEIMRDGINAGKYAEDYVREVRPVSAGDSLSVSLAPNGGWAAILSPAGE